jgi:hypothetical protein
MENGSNDESSEKVQQLLPGHSLEIERASAWRQRNFMIGQSKTKTTKIDFSLFELAGSQVPVFHAAFLLRSGLLPKLHTNANRCFSIEPFK